MKQRSTTERGGIGSRLIDIKQAAAYLSLGETMARALLVEIGARRKFGAATRYDRNVIDRYLDGLQPED